MDTDKAQQMQFFQENLNAILMQKQAFQMELNETVSSLKEVENSKGDVYKIVGQIMVKSPKEKIVKELKNKESIIKMRLERLEDQEEKLSSEVKKVRDELINSSKKE